MPAVAEKNKIRLLTLYEQLPPQSQDEVLDFVDYLAARFGKRRRFLKTSITQVAGCLNYKGQPKTVQDMNNAIATGIARQWEK